MAKTKSIRAIERKSSRSRESANLKIPSALARAIEAQRLRLLGVLGTLQVMDAASQSLDQVRELDSCIAMLLEQVGSIVEELERPVLERSTAAEAQS